MGNDNNIDNEIYQVYREAYERAEGILRSITRLQSSYYSSKVSILVSLDSNIDELRELKKEMRTTLDKEAKDVDISAEKFTNVVASNDENAKNESQDNLEKVCKRSINYIVTNLGKINGSLDEMKKKILDESHIVKL